MLQVEIDLHRFCQ